MPHAQVMLDDYRLHTILNVNPPRQISSLLIYISPPSSLSLHVWSCEDQSRDNEQEMPRIALEQVTSGCLGYHYKPAENKSNVGEHHGNLSNDNMEAFRKLFDKRASSRDGPDVPESCK